MPLFPPHLSILQRGLEAAAVRQAALAHNLANVNTPGYKALRVRFEEHLAAALEMSGTGEAPRLPLRVTHPRHLRGRGAEAALEVRPQVVRDLSRSDRADGNNVDVEAEMAQMAANEIWYGALLRQLNDELARLRLAVTEGRR
ncbi:MAG: flagellar basal body rod protein FlgB [Bacillota bacterium]